MLRQKAFTLLAAPLCLWQPEYGPLSPAWSPDHQILATTKVNERFATPEGANYTLFLNGRPAYPKPEKSRWFSAYTNQHTFLTELEWAPDSQQLAFFEKIYDWEYTDPYNHDFDGRVTKNRYYLVIVSRTGNAAGYSIDQAPTNPTVAWHGSSKVALNGRIFDLQANRPGPIN